MHLLKGIHRTIASAFYIAALSPATAFDSAESAAKTAESPHRVHHIPVVGEEGIVVEHRSAEHLRPLAISLPHFEKMIGKMSREEEF